MSANRLGDLLLDWEELREQGRTVLARLREAFNQAGWAKDAESLDLTRHSRNQTGFAF